MIERLICAVFVFPAFLCCVWEFKNEKAETVLRVVSAVLLMFLAMYLGVVLSW